MSNPPGPSTPPRALEHQAAIARAIVKLFELSISDLKALQRGGSRAIEKLLRSYHYWAVEYPKGICPYDHPKLGYFRMTPDAATHDGPTKELHCEHAVPIRWLSQRLIKFREDSEKIDASLVQRLMQLNEIVVVTKAQAKELDRAHRSSMPDGWTIEESHLARLERCLPPEQLRLVGDRLVGPPASAA